MRCKPPERVWRDFKEDEQLTDEQLEKFQHYQALLSEWNRSMNLTAIRGESEIVHRHFSDSLILRKFIDLSSVSMIADIGSGAGFPGSSPETSRLRNRAVGPEDRLAADLFSLIPPQLARGRLDQSPNIRRIGGPTGCFHHPAGPDHNSRLGGRHGYQST